MILGFGSHETELEEAVEAEFRQAVEAIFLELEEEHFVSDELVGLIYKWGQARSKRSKEEYDEHDKADPRPGRYSSFSMSVAHDASHIVGIVGFMHVNTRHALSPDGVACMMTKRLILVEYQDLYALRREKEDPCPTSSDTPSS